ncbi:MAG: hypothetical protein KC503_07355 [Myxococcales bacterium]|nr:hypothetical protein [Myxococcales bacterium]
MRARRLSLGSALVAVVTLAALASPATATVMEALSLDDLARGASHVVEGEVTSKRVYLRGGVPWTDTTVKLSRVLMGSATRGQSMVVRQPGGELGTLGLRVSGAATMRRGETVMLFVRPVRGVYVPVGMTQGKYELYKDSAGTWRARRDLSGVSFAQLNSTGAVVIRPEVSTSQQNPTLATLRLQVQKAVQAVVAERAAAAKVGGGK